MQDVKFVILFYKRLHNINMLPDTVCAVHAQALDIGVYLGEGQRCEKAL